MNENHNTEQSEDSAEVARAMRLEMLAKAILKSRKEAIDGRLNLGIERQWHEDELAYKGEETASEVLKPSAPDGSFTSTKTKPNRSTVVLNITRPYVDAAAAKVADMLLPTDDMNWGIKPTPDPDMANFKGDTTPIIDPKTLQVVQQDGQTVTVDDFYNRIKHQAEKKAERAQNKINDWLVECQFNAETRKVIEDAARIGTAVMKGPVPKLVRGSAVIVENGTTTLKIKEYINPVSKCISVKNLYPDPSCGDNIHNGAYLWEVDTLNYRQVEELLNDDSYISEHINAVLKEGPDKKHVDNTSISNAEREKDLYQVWYYYGYITKENLEDCNVDVENKQFKSFPAMLTFINDKIIKAALQPLDSGKFPYDVFVWSKREGEWVGDGVARQIRTPQRMLTAAVRNMMDNAGNSSGPQIFIKRKGITPADGSYQIYGNKMWFIDDDAILDARTAIQSVPIDSRQAELMGIIQFALKMAEDVTGLPLLLQGQQGKAPETVGGMQMLNNNASTVLRRISRTFDDMLTEPHIRSYYEWLMQYSDDESVKGDYQIEARGSSALVERDIQNQKIAENLQLALNPAFGIDPKKAYAEYLKSQRLNPEHYKYTEEELRQLQSQPQPKDPRIEAAEINNQTKIQIAKNNSQETLQELEIRNQHVIQELQLRREIEMLKLANAKDLSLEQIKADLTKTAMTIKNDRELFSAEADLKRKEGSGI